MIKLTTKFKETEIGSIPEKWNIVNLGETVEIIDGDRGTNYPSGDDFSTGGYCLFLNTKNVPGNNFDFSSLQFISREKDESLGKGKLKRGDFVLTTRGTVGNVAFYDSNVSFENIRINSGMVILRNDETRDYFDSQYLHQVLKSNSIKKQLARLITGSAQPQLPIRDLKNLKLIMPPINEQKQISEILISLDDKIELLRKQNETLEKISQAIFKDWFVNFHFPGYEKVKMVGSELGKIPERWRAGKLGEISSLESGFAFKGEDFVEKSNTRVLKIKDLKGDGRIDLADISFVRDEVKKQDRVKYFKLNSGDIVLAMSGNTTGKIGVIPAYTENLFLNQRVGKFFIKDKKYRNFLYLFLMSGSYEVIILNMGYGSAQPNINPTQIENIDMIIPSNETLGEFENIVFPMMNKVLMNNSQIQTLSRLRDTLLPKLMGGEVRVKI